MKASPTKRNFKSKISTFLSTGHIFLNFLNFTLNIRCSREINCAGNTSKFQVPQKMFKLQSKNYSTSK